MTECGVADDAPVEIKSFHSEVRGQGGATAGVGEFAAAAPDLEGEIVEGVMAVGKCGEDGAIPIGFWISEETSDLLEFLPRGGRGEIKVELGSKSRLISKIREQIRSVDKALGAIVPGKGAEMIAEEERLHERARPTAGPVADGNVLLPGMQVLKRTSGVGFSEPIGHEQGEIKAAVAKSRFSDGSVVELVNSDGDELDFRFGVMLFEEAGFFSESIFEIRVIAEKDAQAAHAASGRAGESLEGSVRITSILRLAYRQAAAEVYRLRVR